MQFNVNENSKKIVQKEILKSKKALRIINTIEKVFLLLWLFGPLIYFIISVLDTKAYMGLVQGEYKKNYEILIMLTLIALAMLFTVWLLIRTLRKKLSSVHISERIDETLEIKDSLLIYMFRVKYQSMLDERNFIVINLNGLENIEYDEKTKHLIIRGKMEENCIKVGNQITPQINVDKMESKKIDIYDYYEPSLIDALNTYYKN